MDDITSAREPYPSATAPVMQATTVHRQRRFEVRSRKLPISKAGPIDAMSSRLGIPVPEMIFGDNLVAVTHVPSGWTVAFRAEDALDAVDKTGRDMLRVSYAGAWSSSRARTSAAGINEVVKPYDWSYSTAYRGTVTTAAAALSSTGTAREEEEGQEEGSTASGLPAPPPPPKPLEPDPAAQIPLELLRRRDPILFFDEVMLYESELDDNGISVLSAKVRVMERRMLLLCRLYMRLDGVLVRVRDTRVYVDFDTDEVIREYTAKEDSFENVKRSLLMTGLLPDNITIALRDANQVADLLPVVEQTIETVKLS